MPPRSRGSNGQFKSDIQHHVTIADPLPLNRLEQYLTRNATTSRAGFMADVLDPRRDIDDECGFPDLGDMPADKYKHLYDSEAIAAQIVDVMPAESWKMRPSIVETVDATIKTTFEARFEEVGRLLNGRESWFQSDESHPLFDYMCRADKLSGIGHYGIILLGIDDGRDLSEPADLDASGERELLYVRVFDESLAPIIQWEENTTSPRFGQPTLYRVSFFDPRDFSSDRESEANRPAEVHWSRVIHISDDLNSSEFLAIPRIRPVLKHVMNLMKIYHGDAESYWKNASMKLFFETHPQLGGDVDVDAAGLRDTMEKMLNGLQQYGTLSGMSANVVAPEVVDPASHIQIQIDAICIKLRVPKRIFLGSERGELSSAEDARSWKDRLKARQNMYLTPKLIVPLIDRLIAMGVLPVPQGSYNVLWPSLDTMEESTLASVAEAKTRALVGYVTGGVEQMVTPEDWLTEVLQLSPERAEMLVKRAKETDSIFESGEEPEDPPEPENGSDEDEM